MNGVTEDYLESIRGTLSSSSVDALRVLVGDALSGRLTADELLLGVSRHSPPAAAAAPAAPDPARELELVHRWASSPARLSRRAMLSAAGGDT